MKKTYITPSVEVIDFSSEALMLGVSSETTATPSQMLSNDKVWKSKSIWYDEQEH